MAKRRKARPGIPHNSLSRTTLVSWVSILGFVGLAVLTERESILPGVLLPLVILLGLVTLAWTIQCWRLGCVPMVGNMGQIHYYHRKTGPVGFYFVLSLYVLGCAGLLLYPTQQLLSAWVA